MTGGPWDWRTDGTRIWHGAYEYTFGRDRDDKWHYSDWRSWRITERNVLKRLAPRAEALTAPLAELRQRNELSTVKTTQLLDWLRTRSNDTPPAAPKPVSIFLNNVAATQRLSSFKTLTSVVEGHVTVQMMGLPDGQPCWFYAALDSPFSLFEEYLLLFPEIFCVGDKRRQVWNPRKPEEVEEGLTFVAYNRLLHEFSILGYRRRLAEDGTNQKVTILLRDTVTLAEYKKGRVCRCIPIPGEETNRDFADKIKLPQLIQSPEVVVSSPAVQKTLRLLSDLWQDRLAKSVLLSAPPGSGKENYAVSIPYGNGRLSSGGLPTLAFPSGAKEDLERQLYGVSLPGGGVNEGMIAKAAGKALFLDEVHHPDDQVGIRASLLRTLESDDYTPVGSTTPAKAKDVLFILATSRRLKDTKSGSSGNPLAEIDPIDFWTRMTHVIQIDHPLDFEPEQHGVKHAEVLQSFFKLFWWQRVEGLHKIVSSMQATDASTAGDALKLDHVTSLLAEPLLRDMAEIFSSELERAVAHQPDNGGRGARLSELSIRGVRTIVTRMVSLAVGRVARGDDIVLVDEKNLGPKNEGSWDFRKDLSPVIAEILDVAMLSRKRAAGPSPGAAPGVA